MSEEIKDIKKEIQVQRIDLIALAKRLWCKRKFIILITGSFMFIGLLLALFSPKVFTASCTFVPQSSKRTSSSVSSLAALAGINVGDLNGTSQTISPLVYPQVLENVNFLKDLMYSKVKFNNWDEPITLLDFYTNPDYQKFNLKQTIKKYTIGLPSLILHAIKGDNQPADKQTNQDEQLNFYSKEEYICANILKKRITMTIEDKKGYITIKVSMPEPVASAQFAQRIFDLLQDYITEFKIQKAKAQMEFIEGRLEETKSDFEKKQLALAEFQDANRVISSATARTKLDQLTSQYNVANTIYLEMTKQYIQAGIQVKEDTPILTAVKPVVVPYKRSNSRSRVLIIWTILGGLLSCGLVVTFDWLKVLGSSFPSKWTLDA